MGKKEQHTRKSSLSAKLPQVVMHKNSMHRYAEYIFCLMKNLSFMQINLKSVTTMPINISATPIIIWLERLICKWCYISVVNKFVSYLKMILFGSDNEATSVGNVPNTFVNYMLHSSIHHSYFRFQIVKLFSLS